MSSINSLNSSKYSRVTGLASGMDTDSIVEKMMSGTQAKIDKVNQQKQLLAWKQEEYRSIISKIKSFQDKYFNSSSGCLYADYYSSRTVSLADSAQAAYVSITASASASVSDIELSDIQLATRSCASTSGTAARQIEIGFDAASAPIDLTGKTFELTVDGVTKTISFSKAYNSAEELSADIKTLSNAAFGTDRLTVSASDGKITINSDGAKVTVADSSENGALGVAGMSLINDSTSRIDLTKSLAENSFAKPLVGDSFAFTINGERFEFSSDTTVGTVINTINNSSAGVKLSYSSVTDKFTLTSTSTGSSSGISIADESGNFMDSIIGTLGASNYTQGTDASVYINGTKVTRSDNSFTIDGVTYNLKANTSGTINATVTTDVDKAVKNIKAFVDDYNSLLDTLNSKLSEARYRDYEPLTDSQKSEMTESQITKWEEKAKSGLLNNDTALSSIVTSLRKTMYTAVAELSDNSENLDISMSSIGISTENYQSKGKLTVNEDKLRTALTNNPEKVVSLFTQKSDKIYLPTNSQEVKAERYKEEGIMNRLSDIINDATRTTYGGGVLLKIAGYTGSTTESENTISKSIKSYEEKLDKLLESYDAEKTRYYNQFTTMEEYIAKMNQQISWLSSSD